MKPALMAMQMRWLSRLFSPNRLAPAVLALACVVLPQQVRAQTAPATVSLDDAIGLEGEDVVFILRLDRAPAEPVTFAWATFSGFGPVGAAIRDVDFTFSGTLIEFDTDTLTAPLRVPTAADDLVEGDESFQVTGQLLNPSPHIRGEDGRQTGVFSAIGTIRDEDTAYLSVAPASVYEGEALAFAVQVTNSLTESVEIQYATRDVTGANAAQAVSDYTPVSGTLRLAVGTETATITVQSQPDMLVEGDEQFELTLAAGGLPDNVTLDVDRVTGTIRNHDGKAGTLNHDASAVEGQPPDLRRGSNKAVGSDVSTSWEAPSAAAIVTGEGADVTGDISSAVTILDGATEVEIDSET